MITLLLISGGTGVIVLALVRAALRRQARRARADALTYTPITLDMIPAAWATERTADLPHVHDAAYWWAVGALSDVRRRVADRDDLAEFAGAPALLEPATWHALTADWPRLQALLATPPVRCGDPNCPDFGDPDFGEGTCPSDHSTLLNPGRFGWAPPSGHAVTLPADSLLYDRYPEPRCGELVPQAVNA